MKKRIDCFVVEVFVISSQKYWSKVYILQIFKKKKFNRKLIFSKKLKKKYMSPYYFVFYIQYEFM